ncbi:MAG: hypothetical protein ABR529_06720 [Actinomycetota bacterium]
MTDIASDIVRQQAELFGHLPGDEIGDDDALEFKTDLLGRLVVRTQDAAYLLHDESVWRYRDSERGEEVACYRDGKRVASTIVPSNTGRGDPSQN